MSIPHFTALSGKRRTEFLTHPDRFTCQEKIDGTNFIIGCDQGKLWTSRKNGKEKRFSVDEWGNDYWTTHFREAHAAAENLAWYLTSVMETNTFVLECELLSSNFPNTIEYNKGGYLNHRYDNVGRIVVYKGLPDHTPNFGDATMVTLKDVPKTYDGMSTVREKYGAFWYVARLRDERNFVKVIEQAALKPTLEEQNTFLLDMLVRQAQSQFDSPEIEGKVFKHKTDGWMLKLVDKELFTKRNTENYAVRKLLFKTPGQKTNSVSDIFCRNIQAGMQESEAKSLAYKMTSERLYEYLTGKLPDSQHIHRRNMEAFAALHQQFSQ